MKKRIISDENKKIIDSFTRSLRAKKRTQTTIYNYVTDVEIFIKYCNKNIVDITENDFIAYMNYFKSIGNSSNRLIRRCRVVSSFYNFLCKQKIVNKNITKSMVILEFIN